MRICCIVHHEPELFKELKAIPSRGKHKDLTEKYLCPFQFRSECKMQMNYWNLVLKGIRKKKKCGDFSVDGIVTGQWCFITDLLQHLHWCKRCHFGVSLPLDFLYCGHWPFKGSYKKTRAEVVAAEKRSWMLLGPCLCLSGASSCLCLLYWPWQLLYPAAVVEMKERIPHAGVNRSAHLIIREWCRYRTGLWGEAPLEIAELRPWMHKQNLQTQGKTVKDLASS